MTKRTLGKSFRYSALLTGVALAMLQGNAAAQTADAAEDTASEEIVVTGSRIRREASDTTTSAPVSVVNAQQLQDRGFTQAGEALNQVTAITPDLALTPHNGAAAGNAQQFPNLFNLGPARTLTLVNGYRFVNSGAGPGGANGIGLGDAVVDTNMIPTGLLDRIEIVQGGGSVVYGSGGISGVVNYILKDDFEGFQIDLQQGRSDEGDADAGSIRLTAGADFAGGRGNIAANLEFSNNDTLLQSDRPGALTGYTAADANPLNVNSTDGIPSVLGLDDSHFWAFNQNGVVFVNPPGTNTVTGYQAAFGGGFFVTNTGAHYSNGAGGIPQQFAADGSGLINYNPGSTTISPGLLLPSTIPFANGGDGYDYRDLAALRSGVERRVFNLIGHYDFNNSLRLSGEFLAGYVEGTDPLSSQVTNTVLNFSTSGAGAIPIRANNPFLAPSARATIANYLTQRFGPGLAGGWQAGAPIPGFQVSVSKAWEDLVPSRENVTETDTYHGRLTLDGEMEFAGRNFDWSLSASRGHSEAEERFYSINVANFNRAVNVVTNAFPANGLGPVVCAVNNVAAPVDPACTPINIFTAVLPEATADAVRSYVSIVMGQDQISDQENYLATFGGDLFQLPAGPAQFSLAAEYRVDEAEFTPTQAAQLGLGPGGAPSSPTRGDAQTTEISAEVLIPVISPDMDFPFAESLEFSASVRGVDHSIAGRETVWNGGVRYEPVEGLTLRASQSRNFRAPNLTQLYFPSTTQLGTIGTDPCDNRRITGGPNGSANRLANCQAEWAAHPGYGSLAGFQDTAQNFATAQITTVGNPNLENELSDVLTYGIVFQPSFVPGLTITIDHIEVELQDALTNVGPADLLIACYDSTPAQFAATPQCGGGSALFTRAANGQMASVTSTYRNAASLEYQGNAVTIEYGFDAPFSLPGNVNLRLQGTNNEVNDISILGGTTTSRAGTIDSPDWVATFNAAYSLESLRVSYQVRYLSEARTGALATIETTPYPEVDANYVQDLSMQWDATDLVTFRAGVANLADEEPSFPVISYGDIVGRRFFVGLNAHF